MSIISTQLFLSDAQRRDGGEREGGREGRERKEVVNKVLDFLLPDHFPFQNDKFIFIAPLLK